MFKVVAIIFAVFACIIFPPFLLLAVPMVIAMYLSSSKAVRQAQTMAQLQHRARVQREVGKYFSS